MVQISIENTEHLFTIRITTFEQLIKAIVDRVGTTNIFPIYYLDKQTGTFVEIFGEDVEPFRRKTHLKIRLGNSETNFVEQTDKKQNRQNEQVHRWPNGRVYVGEWHNGEMNGEGIETWPNGSQYQGQFKANKRHGRGIFTWPDGRQYVGEYQKDFRHGYGIYTSPDGYKYEGEWYKGKKHGYGIEIFSDGYRYNGIFENDKYVTPINR